MYVQVSYPNTGGTDYTRCTSCGKTFQIADSRYYIHGMILCSTCYLANYSHNTYTYGNDPNCYGYVTPKGWECPRCHKIWSPTTPACYACNGTKSPPMPVNFYDLAPAKICEMFGWDLDNILGAVYKEVHDNPHTGKPEDKEKNNNG